MTTSICPTCSKTMTMRYPGGDPEHGAARYMCDSIQCEMAVEHAEAHADAVAHITMHIVRAMTRLRGVEPTSIIVEVLTTCEDAGTGESGPRVIEYTCGWKVNVDGLVLTHTDRVHDEDETCYTVEPFVFVDADDLIAITFDGI